MAKLYELVKHKKPLWESSTPDKMLGNFYRLMEVNRASIDAQGKVKDVKEHMAMLKMADENPADYISDLLHTLRQGAQEALDARDKWYGNPNHNEKSTSDRDKDKDKRSNRSSADRAKEKSGSDKSQHGGDVKTPKGDREKGRSVYGPGSNPDKPKDTREEPSQCNECGGLHRGKSCIWTVSGHPGVNNTKTKWEKSAAGLAAKEAGHDCLPWAKNLDGTPFQMKSKDHPTKKPKDDRSKGGDRPKYGMGNGDIQSLLSHLRDLTKSASNLELVIPVTNRKQGQKSRTRMRGALIDTGAVDSTYISRRLANRLVSRYGAVAKPNSTIIYTPDKGAKPFFSQGELDFDVIIFDEIKKMSETITLKGLIIDSPLDLIIGLPDIRKYGLLRKCEEQILNFGTENRVDVTAPGTRLASECSRPPPSPVATRNTSSVRPDDSANSGCSSQRKRSKPHS
jgi:hypothetical protein